MLNENVNSNKLRFKLRYYNWRRGWDQEILGNWMSFTQALIMAYVERASLYFQANGISEEKQLPVFLSSIGGKTYELLRNLLAPTLPKDKSLAEVIAVLEKHFDPKPAMIAERFKFHKRDQHRWLII